MKSLDLVEQCPGLTYRKLDWWCTHGIFSVAAARLGSGNRRDFTEEDLLLARLLAHVSLALDVITGGRGGIVNVYAEVAARWRDGEEKVVLDYGHGVTITVDTMFGVDEDG